MSLEDAIRKARGKDLTETELHSAIKAINKIGNKIIRGDNMKTFRDKILECENPKEVLKSFNVDGFKVELTAEAIKSVILQENLIEGIPDFVYKVYARRANKAVLMTTLKKINDDTLEIETTQECECGGSGEIDCPTCDGLGSHYCYECEADHECSKCEGTGGIECGCIENPIDNEEILYHEIIVLNQGELF